ncbi:MAG: hypothetical protein WBA93_02210 [Microcoleaceae cyanobacterium]
MGNNVSSTRGLNKVQKVIILTPVRAIRSCRGNSRIAPTESFLHSIPNLKKVVTVLISTSPPAGQSIVEIFYEIGIKLSS